MTFFLSVAIALGAACAFAPALGLPKGRRLVVLGMLSPAVLFSPLLIAPDRRLARLLAGVLTIAPATKLFDLHLGAALGDRPGEMALSRTPPRRPGPGRGRRSR